MPSPSPGAAATPERIERNAGRLATAAIRRMETQHDWYRALSAQDRSWVGLVAQAGIATFLAWYRDPERGPQISADVFGTAPRELTRSISLGQTLNLVRSVVDAVEEDVGRLAAAGEEQTLREAVLRYSREIAFSAAQVYAEAAEARGAWDARLESLVVDAVLRGEADDSLQSQAAALGWGSVTAVAVLAGSTPADTAAGGVVDALRRAANKAQVELLAAVQGRRLVAVLGDVEDPMAVAAALGEHFGDGPVVVGPTVPRLFAAGRSARAALSGLEGARAWLDAPRPVLADDLLPERVLVGDVPARRLLIDRVYRPLSTASAQLFETASAFLDGGGGLEAAARVLFVHPNTVRYRIGRIEAVTGYDLTVPRDAHVVRIALAVGRLAEPSTLTWRRPTRAAQSDADSTSGPVTPGVDGAG